MRSPAPTRTRFRTLIMFAQEGLHLSRPILPLLRREADNSRMRDFQQLRWQSLYSVKFRAPSLDIPLFATNLSSSGDDNKWNPFTRKCSKVWKFSWYFPNTRTHRWESFLARQRIRGFLGSRSLFTLLMNCILSGRCFGRNHATFVSWQGPTRF